MPRLLSIPVLILTIALSSPAAFAIDRAEVAEVESAQADATLRIQLFQAENGAHAFMTPSQHGFYRALYRNIDNRIDAWRKARDWLLQNQPPLNAPAVAHDDWRKQLQEYVDEIGWAEAALHSLAMSLNNHRPGGAPIVISPLMQSNLTLTIPPWLSGFEAAALGFQVAISFRVHLAQIEGFATALGVPLR